MGVNSMSKIQGSNSPVMDYAEQLIKSSGFNEVSRVWSEKKGMPTNTFVADGSVIVVRVASKLKGGWGFNVKTDASEPTPDGCLCLGFSGKDKDLVALQHQWLFTRGSPRLDCKYGFTICTDRKSLSREAAYCIDGETRIPDRLLAILPKTRTQRQETRTDEVKEEISGVPQIFNFEDQEVPTVLIESELCFERNAVCQILSIKDPSVVMRRLSAKGVYLIQVPTMGGMQSKIYIDEKNLYRLIGRSDKPQAEKFMDWVYDEVLPSIRKTGSYSVPGVQGQQETSALETRVRMMISLEEVEMKVSAFRIKELEKLLLPAAESAPA